ncbi:hypothetical protein HK096_007717 [Nowakowskiella sp. JEL0078]|nr:hypothetical protein HK096_007717 [Nowakowskiella sp. JEL0078]
MGAALACIVYDVLKDFGIQSKICGITTDNAKNNATLMRHLRDKILDENAEFQIDQQCNRLHSYLFSFANFYRCIAHCLNLSAQKFLSHFLSSSASDDDENAENYLQGAEGESEDEIEFSTGSLNKLQCLIKKIRSSPSEFIQFKESVQNKDHLAPILDVRT